MTWRAQTLFARVAWIVVGALALTHGLTVLIIMRERGDLGLSMMETYLGRDVAASVAILERVPPSERERWLPTLARQNYRYVLASPPTDAGVSHNRLAEPLTQSVNRTLGQGRVGAMTEWQSADRLALYLPLKLSDGTSLTLELMPPKPTVSGTTVLLLLLQLAALGAAAWFAVRLAVRPVALLAQAADALRPGTAGGLRLSQTGPREVDQAVRAFQAMQGRIDKQLSERLHLLASISHDLQTPIARMRLRAEQLGDDALRGKMLADLQGMQRLVDEGLTYAKTAHAAQEVERPVDVMALLDGLVCDASDAGHRVTLSGHCEQPLVTRVHALSRVMSNLIDNAIKFGGHADLVVAETPDGVSISVLDQGPGIPPEQLDRVFDPFFRVEGSRSRDTGGTGLGLAIAQQLNLALGGRLCLSNRANGGLLAHLILPRP